MGDVEFAFFVILLAVAGNETTRNAMTHGMNAFFDNPDQWELFKRDRPETAVDEIIRWATPVHCFQRTALADVEIGDVTIARRPAGRAVLQLGQLRRRRLRPALRVRHSAQPQPALGVRRQRRTLLHRRQPRPHGDQADLQRDRRPDSGHRETVRTATTSVGLDQRRQGAAGRLRWLPTGAGVRFVRAHPRLVRIGARHR